MNPVLQPALQRGLVRFHTCSRGTVFTRAAMNTRLWYTRVLVQLHTHVHVPRSVPLQTHTHPTLPGPWAVLSARPRCKVWEGCARRLGDPVTCGGGFSTG